MTSSLFFFPWDQSWAAQMTTSWSLFFSSVQAFWLCEISCVSIVLVDQNISVRLVRHIRFVVLPSRSQPIAEVAATSTNQTGSQSAQTVGFPLPPPLMLHYPSDPGSRRTPSPLCIATNLISSENKPKTENQKTIMPAKINEIKHKADSFIAAFINTTEFLNELSGEP